MKVSLLIQARTASTRLPGKIYKELYKGKTVLECAYDAALKAMEPYSGVVRILGTAIDLTLEEFCTKRNLPLIRVQCLEEDLYTRYLVAAKQLEATHIIRWTSDCHLLPAPLVPEIMTAFNRDADYVSNTIYRTYPEGMDLQGATLRFYEWAGKARYHNREHPFSHVDGNAKVRERAIDAGYKIISLIHPDGGDLVKWGSIDTWDDLERMRHELNFFETCKANPGVARQSKSGASPERFSWDQFKAKDTIH